MKVIIFKIVASPAFITCALNPSLVSAAVTIPPPALAAPSTPNVSPGERRLEPIEANGNEERAPSPEVIANAAKELPSASTLGNVVSGVMKIASGTVSAAQGTANMWSRLFWDIIKMGPQFLLVGEKREILMAMHAASLILDNGQRDALEGVRYLRIVAEQWKTKTLTEVVQLLDPSKEKLDPFTLVVLGNLANLRRKAPDEMKNLLTKTPARSKDGGFTDNVIAYSTAATTAQL
uniref:RxLR effector candidate protein n=1 Tax=Hyaloperonospora arabidopsidis (strain Emoy2) TaxID=559515 RepID=M4BGU8_HYAAE|nr:RxLR effector candidate protein [Hyaloperonospora arabidopsidis Emoy2]